jgi:hypothetical protein
MNRQMELFRGGGITRNVGRNRPAGEPRERSDDEASEALAVDSSDRGSSDQDRHTSAVKRAPVQTIGLARPLAPPPFDFAAAILADPRAVPQPDVPVPEWLRLPTDHPPS